MIGIDAVWRGQRRRSQAPECTYKAIHNTAFCTIISVCRKPPRALRQLPPATLGRTPESWVPTWQWRAYAARNLCAPGQSAWASPSPRCSGSKPATRRKHRCHRKRLVAHQPRWRVGRPGDTRNRPGALELNVREAVANSAVLVRKPQQTPVMRAASACNSQEKTDAPG
jgi:hypothetical protein